MNQLASRTRDLINLSPKQEVIFKTLNNHEKQIAETILSDAKPFNAMTDIEYQIEVNRILLTIHSITGWIIPADEIMLIFIEQLKQKIKESWSYMNAVEFAFAFRHYSSSIKDWGKSMNLSLIDETIILYRNARIEVVKQFQIENEQKQIENSTKLSDDDWIEFIDLIYINYMSGKFTKQSLPVIIYDRLESTGLIDYDKEQIWEQAKQNRLIQISNEFVLGKISKHEANFSINYIKSGIKDKTHPEDSMLRIEAKQLCLCKYFNSLKKIIL